MTKFGFIADSFRVSLFIELGAHEILEQGEGEPLAFLGSGKTVIGGNLQFGMQ